MSKGKGRRSQDYYDESSYSSCSDSSETESEDENEEMCANCTVLKVLEVLAKILPFVMIIICLGIIAFAIFGFIFAKGKDFFICVFIGVYIMYVSLLRESFSFFCSIFAALAVIAELKWKDFLMLVPFLILRRYRGIFILFTGMFYFIKF
jgi:hypothetical protein